MLFRSPSPGALALVLMTAFNPVSALADDGTPKGPTPISAPDEDETPPELVPYRADAVQGHLVVGLTGSLEFPFGSVSDGVLARERSGWGGGGTIDLSYGVDRFVALGAYGGVSRLGPSNRCEGCTASLLGAGGLVSYHISQGLKLDPWISYGFGIVAFGNEDEAFNSHYSGLEIIRLQVGANWYGSRHFILGPTAGLSIAHLYNRPPEETSGGPLVRALLGLRVGFDVPGRP